MTELQGGGRLPGVGRRRPDARLLLEDRDDGLDAVRDDGGASPLPVPRRPTLRPRALGRRRSVRELGRGFAVATGFAIAMLLVPCGCIGGSSGQKVKPFLVTFVPG